MNLPNVFQNKNINTDIDNQQKIFYGARTSLTADLKRNTAPKNIDAKLKQIFSSTSYVYKIKVKILTNHDEFTTTIVGKNNSNLITYDSKLIPIKDIIDIYEI